MSREDEYAVERKARELYRLSCRDVDAKLVAAGVRVPAHEPDTGTLHRFVQKARKALETKHDET